MTHTARWVAIKRQMDADPNHEKHGTRNGYSYYQCDCAKCRLANANSLMEFRQRKQAYGYSPAWDHGTISTYNNYGCRCDPCTKAQAEAKAEYRRQVKERAKKR